MEEQEATIGVPGLTTSSICTIPELRGTTAETPQSEKITLPAASTNCSFLTYVPSARTLRSATES